MSFSYSEAIGRLITKYGVACVRYNSHFEIAAEKSC